MSAASRGDLGRVLELLANEAIIPESYREQAVKTAAANGDTAIEAFLQGV